MGRVLNDEKVVMWGAVAVDGGEAWSYANVVIVAKMEVQRVQLYLAKLFCV